MWTINQIFHPKYILLISQDYHSCLSRFVLAILVKFWTSKTKKSVWGGRQSEREIYPKNFDNMWWAFFSTFVFRIFSFLVLFLFCWSSTQLSKKWGFKHCPGTSKDRVKNNICEFNNCRKISRTSHIAKHLHKMPHCINLGDLRALKLMLTNFSLVLGDSWTRFGK